MNMEVQWYRGILSCYWRFKINKLLPLKERQYQRHPQIPKTKKTFSMWHKWVNLVRRAFFCLFVEWGGVKDSLPELHQAFEVTAAQTSALFNLVFSCQPDFFSSVTMCLLLKRMTVTEPTKATAWLLRQGQNCLPAKCGTSSTKILLDSCRVFLEYAKIKQAKERLCWWSE